MWDDCEDGQFVEPGKHCGGAASGHQSERCEITLIFTELTPLKEFKTHLFVCGRELTKHCQYFEGLLLGGFKEQNSKEANIHNVSRTEMLLFLRYAMRPGVPLPLGKESLCTLIKVSDQFLCTSLQMRLADHLDTESFFFDAPAETKLELIKVADLYRCSTWCILDACIRLCANLSPDERDELDDSRCTVSTGTKAVIDGIMTYLAEQVNNMQQRDPHRCERCSYDKTRIISLDDYCWLKGSEKGPGEYEWSKTPEICNGILRVDGVEKVMLGCRFCGGTLGFNNWMTYEKLKEFEIDRSLLRN